MIYRFDRLRTAHRKRQTELGKLSSAHAFDHIVLRVKPVVKTLLQPCPYNHPCLIVLAKIKASTHFNSIYILCISCREFNQKSLVILQRMKLHYANISSHNEFYKVHKPSNIINLYIYWKAYYYCIMQIVRGGKVSWLYSNSKHLIIRKKKFAGKLS